ncbi:MAG: AmmeMemoRadiSam system protein B [Chloroflexota bacterium]|nr:AmmeMemoRadiSam system protein B [Chloroflexota bacterium]
MIPIAPRVRRPAVAGSFYPGVADNLRAEVEAQLNAAIEADLPPVRALIVPHAGYRFSGPVAASGFRQLTSRESGGLPTIFLLGPAHHYPVRDVALAPYDRFDTPLGSVPQKKQVVEDMLRDPRMYQPIASAHDPEHCLEVELPFLQMVLGDFDLVAMLCGRTDIDRVASDLAVRVGPDDLVIVSSDLSHFYAYDQARRLDRFFLEAVLAGDFEQAAQGEACGLQSILILMRLAQMKNWRPTLLDYRNSGDTGGDRFRVVGYAALAYTD